MRKNAQVLESVEQARARVEILAELAIAVPATGLSNSRVVLALDAVTAGYDPDDPTNHLDINSIEAVERGLNSFDGAILVVSHDEVFLRNVNATRRIELSSNT